MKALFDSGLIYGVILVGMGAEALVLSALYWRTKRQVIFDVMRNVLAGVALLSAALAQVDGRAWGWIAAYLLLALGLHMQDLRRLWRR